MDCSSYAPTTTTSSHDEGHRHKQREKAKDHQLHIANKNTLNTHERYVNWFAAPHTARLPTLLLPTNSRSRKIRKSADQTMIPHNNTLACDALRIKASIHSICMNRNRMLIQEPTAKRKPMKQGERNQSNHKTCIRTDFPY